MIHRQPNIVITRVTSPRVICDSRAIERRFLASTSPSPPLTATSPTMMGAAWDSSRVKPEFPSVKREHGPPIKSEFEPSLASFPMAPPKLEKKDQMEDKKLVLANIPEARRPSGRARRRHFNNFLTHRVDGFVIRAHHGKGKVDFTITKQGGKTGDLNWKEIEREMFRKLRRAHFHIEPTTAPGPSLSAFCSDPSMSTLQFSLQVRPVQTAPQLPQPRDTDNKHGSKDQKGNCTGGLIFPSASSMPLFGVPWQPQNTNGEHGLKEQKSECTGGLVFPSATPTSLFGTLRPPGESLQFNPFQAPAGNRLTEKTGNGGGTEGIFGVFSRRWG